jgi:hypothetical protein
MRPHRPNTSNMPNRTPFDNNLVDDPHAPRHTQPLPASPQHPQAAGPGAGQRAGAGRPRSLPPQVVTGSLRDDEDDDLYFRQPRQRQGLPTATVIGVAMMAGALVVIIVSSVVFRVVPRPQSPLLRPQNAPAPGLVAPAKSAKKAIAEAPAEEGSPTAPESGGEPEAAAGTSASETTNGSESRGDGEGRETVAGDKEELTGTRLAAGEERGSGRTGAEVREREPDGSDAADERSGVERSRANRSRAAEPERDEPARGGDHFVSERSGYAISPPAGFTLQKSGRRTTWRGPDGAQLLVETAAVGERSPRADWERMDKGFRKKYGDRYRSYGIYETTLAGHPAAAWEFEIGATRKIDVAVHHRGTGYAVLGAAPAARFEQVRPQIEAAIRSFRLPANRLPVNGEDGRDRKTRDAADAAAGSSVAGY